MKQIIKAIWKSNEVPTNEYFLWLKHEDNGFMLYVRGQRGWEPITSEGQISDVYTKEEIDAILEDYYKKTESDEKYLPLTAGEDKPLTNPLYCKSIYPTNTSSVIGYPDDAKKFTFYGRTINFQDYNYLSFERSTSFTGNPNTGMIDVTVKNVTAFLMEITIAGLSIYKFIVRKNTGSPAMSYVQVAGTPLPVRVGEITGDGKTHILIGEENTVFTEYTIVKLEMNCSNDGSSGGIYFATAFAKNKKTTDYDSVAALTNENP